MLVVEATVAHDRLAFLVNQISHLHDIVTYDVTVSSMGIKSFWLYTTSVDMNPFNELWVVLSTPKA